jgi:hypothetical protein
MWYIVRFTYGETDESLIEWVGPIKATNPEAAVREAQSTPWDGVKVYPLEEDPNGDLSRFELEDLNIEAPETTEAFEDVINGP